MSKVELILDFPPSVNRLWRISKTGGMYKSKEYSDWRKKALWDAAIQAKFQKLTGSYKLTVKAVRPDNRKRDLDNLIKAVSDVLETSGVIENDHFCEHLEMMWVKEGPACHITIEGIGNEKVKKRANKAA